MKKNRSNSKEVKEAIRLHLIDIAYNDDVEIATVEQAKKYIIDYLIFKEIKDELFQYITSLQ